MPHLQVDAKQAVVELGAKSQEMAESDANPESPVAHLEELVASVVALACLLLALETLVFAALVELVVVATAESVAQAQVAW